MSVLRIQAGPVPFGVKIVRHGERYGLRDCFVHDSVEALIEFYDQRYQDVDRKMEGQFISRYYASTIVGGEAKALLLDGNNPEWTVSAVEMVMIRYWILDTLNS